MEAFARLTRHSLLDSQVDGKDYVFFLRKGSVAAR